MQHRKQEIHSTYFLIQQKERGYNFLIGDFTRENINHFNILMHPAKKPYCMHKLRWRRYLMSKFRKYCGNMKYANQANYQNMNIKEKFSINFGKAI